MAFNVGDLIAKFKLDTSDTARAVGQLKKNLQKTFGQELRDSIRNLAKTQEQVRYESAVAAREAAKHAAQAIKQANAFDKAKAKAALATREYTKATQQYEKYLKLTQQSPNNEKYAKQLELARKQVERRYTLEQRSVKMMDNIKQGAVQMSDGLKRASNNAKNMFDHLKSVERIVGGILISQAFYTVAREIGNAVNELVRFTGEMEKADIVFTHLMGDSKDAQAFIYNMQDFAAETSFATDQALNLAKQLRAVGVPMEQIRSYMTTLNDAAQGAGASSEVVDRIVYALAQIKTTGRLLGTEMRQLANANIPIYKILHEQLGIAEEDLTRVGDLAINGDVAVAAILQGLQQEFEGLAAEVSNSVPGLIDNIKDNLLMLGSTALQGPWESLGGRLRTIRETLDQYREVMANVGFGGLVESIIGKGNTDVLRTVTASIASLVKSMITLGAAALEIAKVIGGALMQTFATILPPIAAVVRALANLVHYAITTIAPIKLLVSAIAGLAISFAVGKSMLFLWRVTGMGIICSTVAKAVLILRNAVLLLYAAIGKNPLVAAILLVTMALLSWVVSLKSVSDWIGRVTAQMAKLFGIDTEDILKVEDIGIGDLAEQYNDAFDSVADVTAGLEENGDEAEKTGKKFKKFLASFDEVFQMPEEEDDKDKKFDIPKLPDLNIPETNLPDIIVPDLTDLTAKQWEWPEWPEWPPIIPPIIPKPIIPEPQPIKIPKVDPIRIPVIVPVIPPIRVPVIPPVIDPIRVPAPAPVRIPVLVTLPSLAPVWEWLRGVIGAFGKLPSWLADSLRGVGTVLGQIPQWLTDSLNRVKGLIGEFPGSLDPTLRTLKDFATDVVDVFEPMPQNLTETVGDFGANVDTWFAPFPAAIADFRAWLEVFEMETKGMLVSFFDSVGEAATNTSGQIATVWSSMVTDWSNWLDSVSGKFATVGASMKEDWGNAMNSLGDTMSSWGVSISAAWNEGWEWLKTTIANGLTAIGDFFTENWKEVLVVIGIAVAGVAAVLLAPFAGVAAGAAGAASSVGMAVAAVVSGLGLLLIPFWDDISAGFSAAWDTVSTWTKDTGTAIGEWAGSMKESIGGWLSSTTSGVSEWASNTGGKIKGWATDGASNFMSLAEKAKGSFSDWTSKAGTNVSSFVTSFGTSVKAIPGRMAEATSTLYSKFKTTMSKLPTAIPTVISNMVSEFKKLPGKIVESIKNIPKKIGEVFSKIKIPSFSDIGTAVKTGWKNISMPGYANGGIITSDHIARVGEGGKREAIIPLENSAAMAPFADAVASRMMSQMPSSNGGGQQQQPVLYVGTLIADDRGIKELERRMNVVRLNETARGVR